MQLLICLFNVFQLQTCIYQIEGDCHFFWLEKQNLEFVNESHKFMRIAPQVVTLEILEPGKVLSALNKIFNNAFIVR